MCASFAFTDPRLEGLPQIGEGEHCRVYDEGNGRVLKVTDCPAAHTFLTDPDSPRGRHYPVVHADYGEVGRTERGLPIYMVEMERLLPLEVGTLPWAVARTISSTYEQGCRSWMSFGENMTTLAFGSLLRTPLGLSQDIHDALQGLYGFVQSNQLRADFLKTENMMMREDGTLVFSDPVFV